MPRKALTLVAIGAIVWAAIAWQAGLRRGRASTSIHAISAADLFPADFHRTKVEPVAAPNVVLICIDTLRADHMSLYGYARKTTPRIDRLAGRCRVFDRAYATSPFTSPSVVSMLTGLYPYNHGVRLLWQKVERDNVTLADHLRRAGYQTAAVVSNLVLSDRGCGLGVRFDHYDDRVDEPEPHRPYMLERRAERTTEAAIAWLGKERSSDRPFFLWVHYIDPHGPYRPPPDAPVDFVHDASQVIEPERVAPYVREPGVTDGLDYVDRYDEEIAYADREVGRLLDALSEMGLADDALIVLTADHGEQMMDGEGLFFCHGFDVRESVIHIPLLVCGKSFPRGRETTPVSIADIMPTVLEAVGLPLPEGLDGRSLLGELSSRPPYAEGPDSGGSGGLRRTFIYPERKIVVQHGRSNIPRRWWAYDLQADPGELHRRAVDAAEPAYMVLDMLIRNDPDPGGKPAKYAAGENPMSHVPDNLDEESLRALKSLGYVR